MAETIYFNGISHDAMKEFLDSKTNQYNRETFIEKDPVSIPHRFRRKQDIEIAGFLTATIAWGRRDLILTAADDLMKRMNDAPWSWIMDADDQMMEGLSSFYYRTFNGTDALHFVKSLKRLYSLYDSMEDLLIDDYRQGEGVRSALARLRAFFFDTDYPARSSRHLADVNAGSAAKRLNMFLRWMIRDDNRGVDFGIWKGFSKRDLMIPLDLHTGNSARKLGLLNRRTNDWKAVEELTTVLRSFDPDDPVRYDYALFSLGVNEKF
ncbi:MAG: TIGR02757 family protein [Bacteroidales bacterium]|nr:TIGR02757 family protein [Bacteroidales bacterium]